jgi:hydroxyacylglutathione hydrolase
LKDRAEFVRYMSEGQPVRPANIERIVATNQGRLPLTMEEPKAKPIPPVEIPRILSEDASIRVLDVREPSAFGAGHVPGSVSVPVSSEEFEQRVGWVIDPDAQIILLGENDAGIRTALHKLAFLGLDRNAQGYVAGGMNGWLSAGLRHETLPQISVHQLNERLSADGKNGWSVVDVREDEEWAEGHIQGASHMNYKGMGEELLEFSFSRDETLAIVCARGVRSSTGASLLRRHGFQEVLNVVGGMGAWVAAGYDVVLDT